MSKQEMVDNSDQATVSDMTDALHRSGYLIESRVSQVLHQAEWEMVDTNAAYVDSDTEKPRELDLRAMTYHESGESGPEFSYFLTTLLIECVNNPQPLALIDSPGEMPLNALRIAGVPLRLARTTNDREVAVPISVALGFKEFHHYGDESLSVARQFCSFSRKKQDGEWYASHDDGHFGAFQTLLRATEHEINEHYVDAAENSDNRYLAGGLTLYYPLLVLGGDLISVRPEGSKVELEHVDHAMFLQSSFVGRRAMENPVDVVTERGLPKYLARLKRQHGELLRRVVSARELIAYSEECYRQRAVGTREPASFRAILEG